MRSRRRQEEGVLPGPVWQGAAELGGAAGKLEIDCLGGHGQEGLCGAGLFTYPVGATLLVELDEQDEVVVLLVAPRVSSEAKACGPGGRSSGSDVSTMLSFLLGFVSLLGTKHFVFACLIGQQEAQGVGLE